MTDYQPLHRRIGYPASDKAWRAHLDARADELRAKHGPLYGDPTYPRFGRL